MRRFFYDGFLSIGDIVTLASDESHHLLHSIRSEVGDKVELINKKGDRATAIIYETKKQAKLKVLSLIGKKDSICEINIFAPVPKGSRYRFLIEKLTELEVSSFTPIMTKRVVKKLSNPKHFAEVAQNISISAMKQAGGAVLMKFNQIVQLNEIEFSESFWIVGMTPNNNEKTGIPPLKDVKKVNILVGPEGGFDEDEFNMLKEKDVHFYSIGNSTLRIETAAIALCSVVKALAEFYQ